MADQPTKTEPTVIPPVTVVPSQTTVETLDTNGNTLSANSNLHDIFSKIESGQSSDEAVKEVMTKEKPEKAKEEPKEVSVTTTHPDTEKPKDKPASLDEQIKDDEVKRAAKEEPKPKSDDEVPEDELKVLPHDKPKTARRIEALLGRISKISDEVAVTKKDSEAKALKLKELETQLSTVKTVDPKTEEAVKAQLDELAMYRRRYDLEKDPEVKTKFDDRINATAAQIDKLLPEILQKHNATPALMEKIKEEGGWQKFSQSNRLITLTDGETITAANLADNIIQKIPFSDRKLIDAITMEQIQLKREKERFVEQEVKTANDYFKRREEEQSKGQQLTQEQVKQAQEMVTKWQQDVSEKNEFMKERQAPANATADQKKQIEEDNAYTKQLHDILKKNISVKDLDGMLNVVLESVKYHNERRQVDRLSTRNKQLEADLKAKQDELDRFKNSGKTTVKAGSLTGGGSPAQSQSEKKPKSLEDALDAIETGTE